MKPLQAAATTAGYVMKETARESVSFMNTYGYIAGQPGAGVGYLAGRTVGALYGVGCKLVNKCRSRPSRSLKHYSMKPVKVFQMMGAAASIIGSSALYPPAIFISALTGAVKGLINSLPDAKKVYANCRAGVPHTRVGTSTKISPDIFQRIYKGDTTGLRALARAIRTAIDEYQRSTPRYSSMDIDQEAPEVKLPNFQRPEVPEEATGPEANTLSQVRSNGEPVDQPDQDSASQPVELEKPDFNAMTDNENLNYLRQWGEMKPLTEDEEQLDELLSKVQEQTLVTSDSNTTSGALERLRLTKRFNLPDLQQMRRRTAATR